MSAALPQSAGPNVLDASLASGPFQFIAAPTSPLPVLSNSRVPGRCRVVNCPVDLNTQTSTNRKYYLCRDHWAAEAVVVEGILQRFCGQCSRFKVLTEYDGPKRTCRQCLFLRNTKKRNQKYESMQKGAYGSSPSALPPYKLDNNGKYLPNTAAAAPVQHGLAGYNLPANFHINNSGNLNPMALLQQQLQQLQQSLPAKALAAIPQQQPSPQQPDSKNLDAIDPDALNAVLGLITSVGVLGDGHTGNPEADALYYLFQELQTLKQEVETQGIAAASMQAKRRKLVAEQELARANFEVAELEEQLIQIAAVNKQKQHLATDGNITITATRSPPNGVSDAKNEKATSEGPSSLVLPLPPAPEPTDEPIFARQSSSG